MIRKKLSLANWRIWTTSVVAVLALGTTIGLVAFTTTHNAPHVRAGTSATSTTVAPSTPSTSTPVNNQVPRNAIPPKRIFCGKGFFTSQDWSSLRIAGGANGCWRPVNGDTWVVAFNGVPNSLHSPSVMVPMTESGLDNKTLTQEDPIAPEGSGYAIERCTQSDQSCLSPSSAHLLSNFTFYWPPEPYTSKVQPPVEISEIPGYLSPAIFVISDLKCSQLFFNSNNGKFYPWADGIDFSTGKPLSAPAFPVRSVSLSAIAARSVPIPPNLCPTFRNSFGTSFKRSK